MARVLNSKILVIASHNSGKIREIDALVKPFGITTKSAAEMKLCDPEETGSTFSENAAIKALAASSMAGLPALSDDSGLCVDALSGRPGIYSARWAGEKRDFDMAMAKVNEALIETNALTKNKRKARFVSVLCLAWPDKHVEFFCGEIAGNIVWPPRGDKGFGYDAIFQPEGYSTTFGEMDAVQKHGWKKGQSEDGLSHRARAFAKFAKTCLLNG